MLETPKRKRKEKSTHLRLPSREQLYESRRGPGPILPNSNASLSFFLPTSSKCRTDSPLAPFFRPSTHLFTFLDTFPFDRLPLSAPYSLPDPYNPPSFAPLMIPFLYIWQKKITHPTLVKMTKTTTTSPPREHRHHTTPKAAMTTDHHVHYHSRQRRRIILLALTIFLLLAGVTVLIVWLVYRPHRPHFSVVGAAIYEMNTTSLVEVTATVQFTVLVHNPNDRVTIYYDRLTAFVSYRNQAITPPLPLPPLVQGHRTTVSMSPMLGGAAVPVAPHVANGLATDEAYGVVGLRLVFLGRLRWKAGAIKTGQYGLYVKCDMMLGMRKDFAGQAPLLGAPDCDVDV